MPAFSSFLVADHLVQPLVLVPDQCLGILVHPGSTIPPQKLPSGWHYHWPFLSVIRVYQFDPVAYLINESVKPSDFGDEPVVAVTQDHRLMMVTGQLELQLDKQAPLAQIQILDYRSLSRVIRPAIRQSIRHAVARFTADHLSAGKDVSAILQAELDQNLKDLPLIVRVTRPPNIAIYKNALTSINQT